VRKRRIERCWQGYVHEEKKLERKEEEAEEGQQARGTENEEGRDILEQRSKSHTPLGTKLPPWFQAQASWAKSSE